MKWTHHILTILSCDFFLNIKKNKITEKIGSFLWSFFSHNLNDVHHRQTGKHDDDNAHYRKDHEREDALSTLVT